MTTAKGHTGEFEPFRPRRAALFSDCAGARLTNCAAQAMKDFVAKFDASCVECVELGNRDFDHTGGFIRLDIACPRFLGMSRRAISAPEHYVEGTLPAPDSLPPGSLAWVKAPVTGNSQLRVTDGSVWKNVSMS